MDFHTGRTRVVAVLVPGHPRPVRVQSHEGGRGLPHQVHGARAGAPRHPNELRQPDRRADTARARGVGRRGEARPHAGEHPAGALRRGRRRRRLRFVPPLGRGRDGQRRLRAGGRRLPRGARAPPLTRPSVARSK